MLPTIAWKGVGGDQGLYIGRGNDSDQRNLAGSGSSTSPALATFVQTFMAWKGIFNDQGIYYSRQRHIDGVTLGSATARARCGDEHRSGARTVPGQALHGVERHRRRSADLVQ